MQDFELLNELKNKDILFNSGNVVKLSKISSFSIGKVDSPPTDTDILSYGINRNFMFLGLNPSAPLNTDWANFHVKDKTRKARSYDYRIFRMLEKYPSLKGIYMTDFGKGEIEGNSNSFIKGLNGNKTYRNRCFEYLNYELGLLNGLDTIIICMHKSLQDILYKYGKYDYLTLYVTHYAYNQHGCGNDDKFYGVADPLWSEAANFIEAKMNTIKTQENK